MKASLVALVFILSILGAMGPARTQEPWIEYRPPGGGFKLEFPGSPKQSQKDVPTKAGLIRLNTAEMSPRNDRAFASFHSSFPPDALPADRQIALDAGRDNAIAKAGGTLRTEQHLSIGGMPARRAVVDIFKSNQVCVSLMVLNGNDLYQAIVFTSAGQEDSDDIRRFINSFALVPR